MQLCSDMEVSKATLDGALAELESRKVLVRKHGIGIFVSPELRRGISLSAIPGSYSAPRFQNIGG
jgi:DNA-binding GntR family transcriptional regulator